MGLKLRGPAALCASVAERFVRGCEEGTLLTLRVSPGAKKSVVVGTYGEHALKLKISAPTIDGKANVETERFLAETLGLSRSGVSVIRGGSSRDKVVLVKDLGPREVAGIFDVKGG